MIVGAARIDEARIRLKVKGPGGRQRTIDAVIDTGYTGSLTLPRALIAALCLRWRSVDRGTLADGSECLFDVYEAKVVWDGEIRDIFIDEADADPLVGMRILRGHELKIEVLDKGKVTLKRLASSRRE
jgi:clan AA aspartic protease